jgi:hypothetical protein
MMHSDQATIRTRWRRMGEYPQATVIIYDPINFSSVAMRLAHLRALRYAGQPSHDSRAKVGV